MSVYWGAQTVNAVAGVLGAVTGNATQLFPAIGVVASGGNMANTDSANGGTYPPTVAAGSPQSAYFVRRPTNGRVSSLTVTGDGTNPGIVELWDVAGTDRGATYTHGGGNNVNNDNQLTPAYLAANGILIEQRNIQGTSGTLFTEIFDKIPFNNGLAVRFYNQAGVGSVSVAPYIEGGFMIQPVVA